MIDPTRIQIKRIYDLPAEDDGFRVLVDRLWPRGLKKQAARIDLWAKNIAPTPELRQWFDHTTDRFTEFSVRYTQELEVKETALKDIFDQAGERRITLLFAARDQTCNHAVVLQKHFRRLASVW